ncbi:MAG: 4Fe-4S dicluster domain-containing protein [Pirellulales bacterium]|nr:4Fe-4S dicluster domain-containing protein [Pirellulales bacterium]
MDRREFLRKGGVLAAGTACAGALPWLPACSSTTTTSTPSGEEGSSSECKYGMVVDLPKCRPGCTACLDACRKENNVAYHGDPRWDVHLIRKVTVERTYPVQGPKKPMLLLCNQCDDPPCAQACPVQATYKRPDGIVVVDQHRCIGCRYCMIACPYDARSFNYKESEEWPNHDRAKSMHGVPESCTFCAHRLDRGEKPACVEACEKVGAKVLSVGNLNDPESRVSRLIRDNSVKALREDLGTKPKVFYIGL